ncbi:isochorismate synthase MenF [Shewanella sp. SR44-3]|uniref:isochorismate synthase n=1 Tax=Shewanella sp. SR44-3 TaxID=2760936 RepID=UPI0015FD9F52|nr:isochorismate synthase [Shewanella sp. SR44-3]MBB1268438.1 isochorismate synthase [Shewanella sp. SR44-3]
MLGHCLLSQINDLIRELKHGKTPLGYHQLSIDIVSFPLLPWLAQQQALPQIYWHGRDNDQDIACIGQCQVFTDISTLPSLPETMSCYGGLGFDINAAPWPSFGQCRFILPRLELRHSHTKIKLLVNFCFSEQNKHAECDAASLLLQTLTDSVEPMDPTQLEAQNQHKAQHLSTVKIIDRHDQPSKLGWQNLVSHVVEQELQTENSKIVLSRRSQFNLSTPINPWSLLQQWQQCNPNSFQFGFLFENGQHFISCSPERLYLRQGRQLFTEALAGTSLCIDDVNTQHDTDLLKDAKNNHEHRLVHSHIIQALTPLSAELNADKQPHIFKQNHIQHLRGMISAKLKPEVQDKHILQVLHPTPAVAGLPCEHALKFIRNNEGYDRGWYAGACGFIGHQKSEFAVAIRSALVQQDKISLFAGAGIVPGSTPEAEWSELESKLATVLSILQSQNNL